MDELITKAFCEIDTSAKSRVAIQTTTSEFRGMSGNRTVRLTTSMKSTTRAGQNSDDISDSDPRVNQRYRVVDNYAVDRADAPTTTYRESTMSPRSQLGSANSRNAAYKPTMPDHKRDLSKINVTDPIVVAGINEDISERQFRLLSDETPLSTAIVDTAKLCSRPWGSTPSYVGRTPCGNNDALQATVLFPTTDKLLNHANDKIMAGTLANYGESASHRITIRQQGLHGDSVAEEQREANIGQVFREVANAPKTHILTHRPNGEEYNMPLFDNESEMSRSRSVPANDTFIMSVIEPTTEQMQQLTRARWFTACERKQIDETVAEGNQPQSNAMESPPADISANAAAVVTDVNPNVNPVDTEVVDAPESAEDGTPKSADKTSRELSFFFAAVYALIMRFVGVVIDYFTKLTTPKRRRRVVTNRYMAAPENPSDPNFLPQRVGIVLGATPTDLIAGARAIVDNRDKTTLEWMASQNAIAAKYFNKYEVDATIDEILGAMVAPGLVVIDDYIYSTYPGTFGGYKRIIPMFDTNADTHWLRAVRAICRESPMEYKKMKVFAIDGADLRAAREAAKPKLPSFPKKVVDLDPASVAFTFHKI